MKVLVLIPARYASTRFPGKPLADIAGKSMIQRVYENANQSGYESCVITDDDHIEKHLNELGSKVSRVDDDVPSGTERIGLAYERFFQEYDLIINVQGDEPMLPPEDIKALAQFHSTSDYDVCTLVRERTDEEGESDPNTVKVNYDQKTKECLDFDRKAFGTHPWYQHIGVYSYKPEVLKFYLNSTQSDNEKTRRLEQMRAMDKGYRYGALVTEYESLGVDTPEDLEKVQNLF
jgi:3-deoxy-manno-octulosonate cytidylyltransferase (CMP-KDO synthetase)